MVTALPPFVPNLNCDKAGSRTPNVLSWIPRSGLILWREPVNLKCESDAAIIMGYTEPEHVNEQACEGVSAVRPQSRIVIDQLFVQPGVACLPAWSVMGTDGQSYLRNRPRAQHVGSTSETRSNATLLEAGETLPDTRLSSADVHPVTLAVSCTFTFITHATGFPS